MAEIKWHDSAREHLRKIFDFNYNNMSEKYAYTILGEVLDEVQGLENAPRKGAPELLLEGRRYEYRYLVVRKTYKVIYFLAEDEVHIVSVWDVRQNPQALIQTVVVAEIINNQ
jgi:plasmid stabilization system protein ParE